MKTIFEKLKLFNGNLKNYENGLSLEIEAEFNRNIFDIIKEDEKKFLENWDVKRDGSLRGFGWEFISKKPEEKNNVVLNVKKLLGIKSFQDFYLDSDRTSTHVHLNVQNWDLEKLKRFLILYYLSEPVLTNWAGKNRIGNLFCLQLHEAPGILEALNLLWNEKYKSLYYHFDNYKYGACNIASIPKLGTVEFRQLRGTKDSKIIEEWINKILRIEKKSCEFYDIDILWNFIKNNPKEIIEDITNIKIGLENNIWDMNFSYIFNIVDDIKNVEKIKMKPKVIYKFKKNENERDILNL